MKRIIIKIGNENTLLKSNVGFGKSKIKENKSDKKFPNFSDADVVTDDLTESKDSSFKGRKIRR